MEWTWQRSASISWCGYGAPLTLSTAMTTATPQRFPREKLAKNPLVEALLELQASPTVPYDFIPGGMQQSNGLAKDFPLVQPVSHELPPGFELPPGAQLELGPNIARARMTSGDGRRMVQVGPEVVTLNILYPYPGFEALEKDAGRMVRAYLAAARPARIRRMGLRYINLLPTEVLDETRLLLRPLVPDALPRPSGVRMSCLFQYPEGTLTVTTGFPFEVPQRGKGQLLDLDFATVQETEPDADLILGWVRVAHGIVYQAFRACLDGRTLQFLR